MARFVQISDLHLGRGFSGLSAPPELCAELAAEQLDALRTACALAAEHNADAILIPGDLFDRAEIDESTLGPAQSVLGGAACPFLVSPGNHDPFGPMSVWNNAALEQLGLPRWPQNVHIFTSEKFESFTLADGHIAVHGHTVVGYHRAAQSPLQDVQLDASASCNVLLLHGALRSERFDDPDTVPFSAGQLAEIGADYTAVGHYHRHTRIEHDGRLLGAYAGVAVPGSSTEDPPGAVLLVEIDNAGVRLDARRTCRSRIARLIIDGVPPIADADDALQRIRSAARDDSLGPDDIVFVTLAGVSLAPLDADTLTSALASDFRHVVMRDETEPALEPGDGAGGRSTIESAFLARLDERIAACRDETQRALLDAARRYGLAALRGRALRPPPVDTVTPEGG